MAFAWSAYRFGRVFSHRWNKMHWCYVLGKSVTIISEASEAPHLSGETGCPRSCAFLDVRSTGTKTRLFKIAMPSQISQQAQQLGKDINPFLCPLVGFSQCLKNGVLHTRYLWRLGNRASTISRNFQFNYKQLDAPFLWDSFLYIGFPVFQVFERSEQ